jgi:hypothetical protein
MECRKMTSRWLYPGDRSFLTAVIAVCGVSDSDKADVCYDVFPDSVFLNRFYAVMASGTVQNVARILQSNQCGGNICYEVPY